MNAQAGLTESGMRVLRYYSEHGNRELYWNYLAQLPGNDGYGRLALGVVRHDNMPGATANLYAKNYAREHNGKVLSEREWDDFGVDLMHQDLRYRATWMKKGRAGLALNLPARDVQDAHDKSFEKIGVDHDAWTPRKLLEAARHAGEADAKQQIDRATTRGEPVDEVAITEAAVDARVGQVWSSMLNNDRLGLERAADTLANLATAQHMPVVEQATYARDMAAAYNGARDELAHDNPNVIGRADHAYMRDRQGEWMEVRRMSSNIGGLDQLNDVTPAERQGLEDTYQLRQERATARKEWHPDDPGRHIDSPHPLADITPRSTLPKPGDDPVYAAIRNQLPKEVSDDKAAEVALRARHAGIHRADHVGAVDIEDRRIVFDGMRRGHSVGVSLDTPAPPKEESLTHAGQLDRQAEEVERQQQEMQQSQQMARRHRGPVMRM